LRLVRPIPRWLARLLSLGIVAAWLVQMAVLVQRSYASAPVSLAADLSRYGSSAQWKGVYYRGDKIGFSVGQTTPIDDGYELREDGQLQMTLLGSPAAVRLRSLAVVDRAFALRRFEFSVDPGTGPTAVSGELDGTRLALRIRTSAGERTETRVLDEPPVLSLNLPRELIARGIEPGQTFEVMVFDPLTLQNAPMTIDVQAREIVRAAGRPVPAFRIESRFSGIVSRSWITDVGDVVKEESPTGLLVVRETPEQAQALAVPGRVQADLLEAAALVPTPPTRIDDTTTVDRLVLSLSGAEEFDSSDLDGAGQRVTEEGIEIRDPRQLSPGPAEPGLDRWLRAEPFLEVDDPGIRREAEHAVETAPSAPRDRAERLLRYVHALLEKRPTVSIPSAAEVLKTKVGDCNEHATLYVAMARALGIPARMAAGLVYLRGAFYYHAWAEVWIAGGDRRGLWLPVDPTLNQFPADATHLRLVRGGLERQAAILALVGRARLRVVDLQLRPGSVPVLVGNAQAPRPAFDLALPQRDASGRGCWSSPGR